MNCTKTQSLLRAFLADELGARPGAEVARHLQKCAACHTELTNAQEFATFLLKVDDYLDDAPGLTVPAGFTTRVLVQARQEARSTTTAPVHARPWSLRAWLESFSLPVRAGIAAAVLLALFGGLKSGRLVSELVTRAFAQEQSQAEAVLGMMPAERAMLQLMLGAQVEGAELSNQAARIAGDRQ